MVAPRRRARWHRVAVLSVLALASASAVELYGSGGSDGKGRVCPRGHFCQGGVKRPCPAGTYNDAFGVSECVPCSANHRCIQGSVKPVALSKTSMAIEPNLDERRQYLVAEQVPTRDCKAGYYCPRGESIYRCGAGYFGVSTNNTSPFCDGLCPKGYTCPPGTVEPIPCPQDTRYFCPAGSSEPLLVQAGRYVKDNTEIICERGFYVTEMAVRNPCPSGTFGSELGETRSSCAGPCEAGHYCPATSSSPREHKCTSPHEFCPQGSGSPTHVSAGYYSNDNRSEELECPKGFFCNQGTKYPCPPGTYNDGSTGLTAKEQCTQCPPGYKCQSDSILPCGSPGVFCPAGDPFAPRKSPAGEYTVGTSAATTRTTQECSWSSVGCELFNYNALYFPGPTVTFSENIRSDSQKCEPGHFCANGERFECPPGTYGESAGLSSSACSGQCSAGYFCPAASTHSHEHECPEPGFFCPPGSGSPHPVQPGYYITPSKDAEVLCEPGHWCSNGIKTACAPGKYGNLSGLQSADCSGLCPPGFICGEGHSDPYANKCEQADEYCPIGSHEPLPVSKGYFSNAQRSWQHICVPGRYCEGGISIPCPAGQYGAKHGLSSAECSGPCLPGHFCLQESTSSTQYSCSDALGRTDDGQTFQANSLEDKRCLVHMLDVHPEQFFEFSLLRLHQERDPLLWELAYDKAGLYSVYNSMEWDASEQAFRSEGNDASQYMSTGWKPSAGSKTMCMWKKFLTDDIYGLDGMQKVESDNDYFMIGTLWSYRDRIFVSSGVNRGGYASKEVAILKDEWVFYCLSSGGSGGSSEAYVATPSQPLVKVWEQADNGLDRGIVAGHLSNIYGRTSTGTTDRPMYHTQGRHAFPNAVYGGILHWNAHLTAEQVQNAYDVTSYFYPGHALYNGARPPRELHCGPHPSIEWPQGFRGRRVGPIPSEHYEKDNIGVYHPVQNPIRQFQHRDFLVPHLPIVLENGPEYLYCPKGSALPLEATEGYYTVVDHQVLCPKGHYCTLGVKRPCPERYFGSETGLATKECSGLCPPGHACSEGTEEPFECPDNQYAPAASAECAPCLGTQKAFCKTSSACCQHEIL